MHRLHTTTHTFEQLIRGGIDATMVNGGGSPLITSFSPRGYDSFHAPGFNPGVSADLHLNAANSMPVFYALDAYETITTPRLKLSIKPSINKNCFAPDGADVRAPHTSRIACCRDKTAREALTEDQQLETEKTEKIEKTEKNGRLTLPRFSAPAADRNGAATSIPDSKFSKTHSHEAATSCSFNF